MTNNYQGKLYQAGSTHCQIVSVSIAGNILTLNGDSSEAGTAAEISGVTREEISVASKVARLPRELVLPDGNMLHIEAAESLDAWLDGPGSDRIAKLESSKTWIIVSVVLAPLCLFAIFKYVVPALAISFASYVPDKLTQITAQHTMEVLDRSILAPTTLSGNTTQAVQQAFAPVLNQYTREGRQYRVLFRQSDMMGANAFALPDGTIVFTDQIVDLMAAQPRELKAILLHEIGHVEKQHSMRLIAESLATTLVITYFFGDVSGLIELFMGVSGTVVQNQYSQRLEAEADDFALEQAAINGLTPAAFADAMTRLAQSLPPEHDSSRIFSSHPLLQERIQKARRAAN